MHKESEYVIEIQYLNSPPHLIPEKQFFKISTVLTSLPSSCSYVWFGNVSEVESNPISTGLASAIISNSKFFRLFTVIVEFAPCSLNHCRIKYMGSLATCTPLIITKQRQLIQIFHMKSASILMSILAIASSVTVKTADQCKCAQVKNSSDCLNIGTCTWANNSCSTSTTTPTVSKFTSYCTTITDGLACAKSHGCAYIESKCSLFSGCASYAGTKNSDCQAFSTRCNFNGNHCVEGDTCDAQTDQAGCESVLQATGKKYCKWVEASKKCQTLVCKDLPATLNTDKQCSDELPGCLTNGKGCLLPTEFQTCDKNAKDDCSIVIAKDLTGAKQTCALSLDGNNCQVKQCSNAPATSTTDELCNTWIKDCKTNGKGCVTTLQTCQTYAGNKAKCDGMIGSDGKCTGKDTGTNCEVITCESNTTGSTDEACKQTQSYCLTTGKGCVKVLPSCTTYKVADGDCTTRVDVEGKCKAPATQGGLNCAVRACTDDVPTPSAENCKAYKSQCLFDGKKCAESLKLCSTYTGTTTTCTQNIGSDGVCQGVDATEKPCVAKDCTKAAVTLKTDAECATYRTGCVTTGKGCVSTLAACSSYTGTKTECEEYKGTDGKCTGIDTTSQACRARVCGDGKFTTDTECAAVASGCVSNGVECVSARGTCSSYKGTKTTCEKYLGTDGKCKGTSDTEAQCALKECKDNTTAKTDKECTDTVAATCGVAASGTGCVIKNPKCSDFIDASSCKDNTSVESKNCTWDVDKCRPAKCTDAPAGTDSDDKCNQYLTGCKAEGTSCIDLNQFRCVDRKLKENCTKDSTGHGCIWYDNKCQEYGECEDLKFDQKAKCEEFSKLCTVFKDEAKNESYCVAVQSCSSITLQEKCVKGSDGDCGWTGNKCQKFSKCDDVKGTSKDQCQTFNSQCVSDGTTCIQKADCSTYKLDISCTAGGSDGPCTWDSAGKVCKLAECKDSTTENTTHAGCYAFSAKTKCTSEGTGCIPLAACDTYTKQDSCKVDDKGKSCVWEAAQGSTTSKCRQSTCTDEKLSNLGACEELGCAFDTNAPTTCIAKKKCAEYSVTQCASDSSDEKEDCVVVDNKCKAYEKCSDASGKKELCQSKGCQFTPGSGDAAGKCEDKVTTCETIASSSECKPLPNADSTSYTVCVLDSTTKKCRASTADADMTTLTSSTCFSYTAKTYTWDQAQNKCVACATQPSTPGGGNTNPGGGATGGSSTSSVMASVLFVITIQLFW